METAEGIELFEMFIDENDDESGIYATSVVESPAIQSQYIALSEEKRPVKLAEVDKKHQILMGALLIPDKPILRIDEKTNKEYHIFFSKDTVRKCAEQLMRLGKHTETTEEHAIELQGNYITEIWLKEDMVHDKSAKYGLDDPIGSLMISLKVPDKAKYTELSESKNGFSLEGHFDGKLVMSRNEKGATQEETVLNNIKPKTMDKSIKDKVVTFLTELVGMDVKLETAMLADGETTLEAEVFEAGQPVFIVNGDERIPLPIGDYKLESEQVLSVIEDGVINAIGEAEEEVESETKQEMETEIQAPAKKVVETIAKETHFSEAQTAQITEIVKDAVTELSKETEVVTEEVETELSEVVEPKKHSPTKEVTKLETVKYATNKRKTTKDRVFARLFSDN